MVIAKDLLILVLVDDANDVEQLNHCVDVKAQLEALGGFWTVVDFDFFDERLAEHVLFKQSKDKFAKL